MPTFRAPRGTRDLLPPETATWTRLERLAADLAARYGYRRIHARLERSGWSVNLKCVHRLWVELALQRPVRRKKARKLGPKPGTSANSC